MPSIRSRAWQSWAPSPTAAFWWTSARRLLARSVTTWLGPGRTAPSVPDGGASGALTSEKKAANAWTWAARDESSARVVGWETRK